MIRDKHDLLIATITSEENGEFVVRIHCDDHGVKSKLATAKKAFDYLNYRLKTSPENEVLAGKALVEGLDALTTKTFDDGAGFRKEGKGEYSIYHKGEYVGAISIYAAGRGYGISLPGYGPGDHGRKDVPQNQKDVDDIESIIDEYPNIHIPKK